MLQVGTTPCPEKFFETCRQLCSARTECLLAVEQRREATYEAFIACARAHFRKV